MLQRLKFPLCAALVMAVAAPVWAQSPQGAPDDQAIQHGPKALREKLTADGYSDVKIEAGSYIVSAKDKDGQHVMMMISPTQMTVMKVPDQNPSQSQAQMPSSDKDEIIQQ